MSESATGTVVLDPRSVDPFEWPRVHRRDMDRYFGGHSLRRALSVLKCLVKAEDREDDCPRCFRPLLKRQGDLGKYYENMFGRAFFSQALEFIRGLLHRARELAGKMPGMVQRYANQSVQRFRPRNCRHPWSHMLRPT